MAKSLLDTIRGNLAGTKSTAPALGQTEQVRGLIQAKSGKQTTPTSTPRQSGMKERMAAQQARLGGQQLQEQGKMQAAQLGEQQADITQRGQQQEQATEQSKQEMKQRADRQIFNTLQDFSRGMRTLENREDIAAMEQVGFLARLENRQYIDNLQKAGRQNRLTDSLSFKEEAAKQMFANHERIVENDLAFQALIQANDRDFQMEVATIDLNAAMELANIAAKDAATQQAMSGVSSLIEGGAKAYGSGMFSSSGPAETGVPLTTAVEDKAGMSLPSSQRGGLDSYDYGQSKQKNWWED